MRINLTRDSPRGSVILSYLWICFLTRTSLISLKLHFWGFRNLNRHEPPLTTRLPARVCHLKFLLNSFSKKIKFDIHITTYWMFFKFEPSLTGINRKNNQAVRSYSVIFRLFFKKKSVWYTYCCFLDVFLALIVVNRHEPRQLSTGWTPICFILVHY